MIKYLLSFTAFIVASWGFAQQYNPEQDKKDVQAVIEQMFNGMRKGDSAMVRATLHPTIRMQSSFFSKKTQKAGLHTEKSADDFVKAVGTPHPEVWDERIENYEIRVDDNMATAWTPYKFYAGEKFSHQGVNAFHLVRDEEGKWRITQITDTRRK